MTKERQLRKQEEVRSAILEAARSIISREGVQGLSIRKLANEIEYSPAIIYHYFKDKNEIVEILVGEGYRRILASIGQVQPNEHEPEKEIREVFTNYIKSSLTSPDEYMAFLLNDEPSVLQKTRLLAEGTSKYSPSLQILCRAIERGINTGRFAPCDVELTAQILWTSAFGLIVKLIIEKDVPEEQVERLIDRHFTMLFNGIMSNKKGGTCK